MLMMFDLNTAKGNHRRKLVFVCGDCGRGFIPREQHVWIKVKDEHQLLLSCPACRERWEKDWSVDTARFYEINGMPMASVTFKNGQTYEAIPYYPTEDSVLVGEYDLPDGAKKEIRRLGKLHFEEQRKKKIGKFEVIDEWDKQEVHVKLMGGDTYVIPFRWAFGGNISLKPVAPDYVMKQVEEKLYEHFRKRA